MCMSPYSPFIASAEYALRCLGPCIRAVSWGLIHATLWDQVWKLQRSSPKLHAAMILGYLVAVQSYSALKVTVGVPRVEEFRVGF